MENQFNLTTPQKAINAKCWCFNLRKISRAVTQYFDHHLAPAGVRSTQFTLLVELSQSSAKTLTEIANGLVMDRTTLTRNLKPLEKQELIKMVSTMDKRAKAYSLTEQGRAVVERATPLWQEAQNHVEKFIGAERYESLLGELNHSLSALPDEFVKNTKGK